MAVLFEQVKQILGEDTNLTEENINQLTSLVDKALVEQKITLSEGFAAEKEKMDADAKEAIQLAYESANERVDELVDIAVDNILAEQEEKLVKNDEYEKMKLVFETVKTVFEQNGFSLNENAVVDSVNVKLEEAKNDYTKLFERFEETRSKVSSLEEELLTAKQTIVFEAMTKDLSETSKEKVGKLAEAVTFDSFEEFKEGLALIVEQAKEKEKAEDDKKKEGADDEDEDEDDDLEENRVTGKAKMKSGQPRVKTSLAEMTEAQRKDYWRKQLK